MYFRACCFGLALVPLFLHGCKSRSNSIDFDAKHWVNLNDKQIDVINGLIRHHKTEFGSTVYGGEKTSIERYNDLFESGMDFLLERPVSEFAELLAVSGSPVDIEALEKHRGIGGTSGEEMLVYWIHKQQATSDSKKTFYLFAADPVQLINGPPKENYKKKIWQTDRLIVVVDHEKITGYWFASNYTRTELESRLEIEAALKEFRKADVEKKLAAIRSIHQFTWLKYRDEIPDLVSILDSDHNELKLAVIGEISGIASEATKQQLQLPELRPALQPIIQLVGDPDPEIREMAVGAVPAVALHLGSQAVDQVVPVLVAAVRDTNRRVAGFSIQALVELDARTDSAISAIIERLDDGGWLSAQAAAALGDFQTEPEKCIAALIAGLKTLSPEDDRMANYARESFAEAFRKFGTDAKDAVPVLIRLLSDVDDGVRKEAAYAIAWIGPAALPSVDALGKTYRQEHDATVKLAVLSALCAMGEEGWRQAADLIQGIENFTISANTYSEPILKNPVEILALLADAPDLTSLNLKTAPLDDSQLQALASMRPLEDLTLPDGIEDEGLRNVADLTNLRNLIIKGPVTDEGIRHLANLVNLETLTIDDSKITDDGLEHLKQLHKLRELFIPDAKFNGEGLGFLADLGSLKVLSLPYANSVTDDSLRHLQHFPVLEVLHLGSDFVTDNGMQHLSVLNRLEELSLRSTGVADRGIAIITKNHADLTRLNLSRCDITSACVSDLSRLKNLKTLIVCFTPLAGYRDVFDTTQTAPVQQLIRALPRCSVVYAD